MKKNLAFFKMIFCIFMFQILFACDNDPVYEPVNEITEPELVSVSDTDALFTWTTDTNGNGFVILDNGMDQITFNCNQQPTKLHYCLVNYLEPGTTYSYSIQSGDKTASITDRSPGTLTTLMPPDEEPLFKFATLNDMHVGEDVAGLICVGSGDDVNCISNGFSWDDENNPYWKFMNESAVNQINQATDIDFVIVKGDVTSESQPEEYSYSKDILDNLYIPYYIARGNHDPYADNGDDYIKTVFQLDSTYYSFEHQGFLFVILDSNYLFRGDDQDIQKQIIWLDSTLQENTDKKVFIISHHPLSNGSGTYTIDEEYRTQVISVLDKYSNIAGILSGHSHRAKVTYTIGDNPILCSETPASKEYPGGYCVISVYESGWMQVFYRANCENCLQWIEMTKGLYFDTAPEILFCDLSDRSFVYEW